jgi:hypothetical protein
MIWTMGPFPERTLLRAAPWPSGAGSERGEVDLDTITPRVAMLPYDLFRRDLLASSAPIPAPTVTEIIDDVVLPLVRQTALPVAANRHTAALQKGSA